MSTSENEVAPVKTFSSIMLDDQDNFQVAKGPNRFAVSSSMSSNTTPPARYAEQLRAAIWRRNELPVPGSSSCVKIRVSN